MKSRAILTIAGSSQKLAKEDFPFTVQLKKKYRFSDTIYEGSNISHQLGNVAHVVAENDFDEVGDDPDRRGAAAELLPACKKMTIKT